MTIDLATQAGRRQSIRLIVAGVAGLAAGVCSPARASPAAMQLAIAAFSGGVMPQSGSVHLLVPELVENGNSVPVGVRVDSPMTERDHVRRIALFSEKNPQPQVAIFYLGPRSGRADVSTRIRLADSQRLVAVAELTDGRFVEASVDVIVTLAACIEN